ncbi:DegV family protein [Neobacillus thermocopriae]|uniref:DegV family protein n=1 Tax=Neobacillus thermocopriae TaxID=1215031 RepID=A0A6B3TRB4_9BACI|nr:DegV family protein [Neobacillus thermocopriae]NEX78976.1 DegV family protein [Neobacillus thermocopriae]
MLKTAWVTDSTAYLDENLMNHPDVYCVPLSVILDGEEFVDGINLTPKQLFERLKQLKSPPKTSQPSVGAFHALYEKLEKKYDQVISVHLSGKLSGTVSSSQQAAKLVRIPVTVFDSNILSLPMSALMKKGMELLEAGKNLQEVIKRMEEIRDTNETYVLVGSLEQLHRGGRLSGLKFILGSMLNIKPIISFDKGSLFVKDKVRSENKAKERILNYFKQAYEKHSFKEVYLLYGLYEEQANEWRSELELAYPELKVSTAPLGAVIGVHAGENTLGISWFNGMK